MLNTSLDNLFQDYAIDSRAGGIALASIVLKKLVRELNFKYI